MIEDMMAHVQANPQAASMVRGMINDPAARREMNRLIQNTGADLQMMDALNKGKAKKHRNERPKRKEILKMQKQNKGLLKQPKLASLKVIKITCSRQVKQIEVPTETFPDNCLSKITSDTNAVLGIKEFVYHPGGNVNLDEYVTMLYVEDSKRVNKLIKQKFGAEYGSEVLVIGGTVDNPGELTPEAFAKLPTLKLVEPEIRETTEVVEEKLETPVESESVLEKVDENQDDDTVPKCEIEVV
jgi:hypothetical protein